MRRKKKKAKKKKELEEGGVVSDEEEEEEEEDAEQEMEEEMYDHEKELDVSLVVQMFCHPKIVQQYILILKHTMKNSSRLNHCAVSVPVLLMSCAHMMTN